MKLSVNLELLFSGEEYRKSLDIISEYDISYFEIWDCTCYDISILKRKMEEHSMGISCMIGNIKNSLLEANDNNFFNELDENFKRAKTLGCKNILVVAEVMDVELRPLLPKKQMTRNQKLLALYEGFNQVARIAEKENMTAFVEPLNNIVDHPNYFLDNSKMAFEIVSAVNSKYLKVLYDVYHMQLMEGNIIATIEKNLDKIGHIHYADVPGRLEPGTGEINYKNISKALQRNGYEGFVVLECKTDNGYRNAINSFLNII